MSFTDLKAKDVVNVLDGKKLGKPIDIIFNDCTAAVEAIVVPGPTKFISMLKGEREGYVVPWQNIRRIGDDVILVELDASFFAC